MPLDSRIPRAGQTASARGAPDRRLNRNDRLVLDCLRRLGRPTKAYELLETLRGDGINAPMTVYRALSRLSAMGSVKKIESLNAFYAVSEGAQDDVCVFLICDACGAVRTREIARPRIAELVDADVHEASIEVRTSCHGEDCAA